MSPNIHSRKSSQQGAALVVALVMLVIMTLLGVSSIHTTVTEEKISGQYRNRQLSFEASEAALRDGEGTADAFNLWEPTDGTNGLYLPAQGAVPIWEDGTTNWTNVATAVPNVSQQPRYTTEYMGGVPRDQNCLLDAEASANQDCWRYAYRISSRGWGVNTISRSVVQSTILSRK